MALVDRRQVLQPLEAVRLEPSLPLVEAGPVHPPLAAGLADVAQLPASSSTVSRRCASFVTASRFCRTAALDVRPMIESFLLQK